MGVNVTAPVLPLGKDMERPARTETKVCEAAPFPACDLPAPTSWEPGLLSSSLWGRPGR